MIYLLKKFYSSSRDKIRVWDQVPRMGLFVEIVNISVTLLFLQEVPFLVFDYALSMSATAI